jgi:glycosyltransferase involved in cell wall biosynthesis
LDTICIVLPVFNEELGIVSFLEELSNSFGKYNLHFLVINDASSDKTEETLNTFSIRLKQQYGNIITLINNEENLGHGASVLKGLKLASGMFSSYIITVDGDGQCTGRDLVESFENFKQNQKETHECVRFQRREPLFRKIVTLIVRLLVFAKSGKYPQDGNTPVRIYGREVLNEILSKLPQQSLIPNVHISILIRSENYSFSSSRIIWGESRGGEKFGSTWKQRRRNFPSSKFMLFCKNALMEIIQGKAIK